MPFYDPFSDVDWRVRLAARLLLMGPGPLLAALAVGAVAGSLLTLFAQWLRG